MRISEEKLIDDLFEQADDADKNGQQEDGQHSNKLRDSWTRLSSNKGSVIGLVLILLIIIFAIFGPMMNNHGYTEQDLSRVNLPPKVSILESIPIIGFDGTDIKGENKYEEKSINENFWFGTDSLGRDVWSRVWQGTRISLYIAFLATILDLFIGVAYGSISAFYGGRIDNVMQRIIEVLVGLPNLIVVILLILVLSPGITSITLALVITGWVNMARIVRGEVLKLKNQEFVLASKTLGAKDKRLLLKHLIPNSMGPIIITTMFTVPSAIFTEAFLSFIGLGIQPPNASLGTIVNDGFELLQLYPHSLMFSATIISLIMISFNLVGDGLRDAFDPKMDK